MWSYNPVGEADKLLFLLLSLLKMSLNESLQLRQVLFHALSMNVLRGETRSES